MKKILVYFVFSSLFIQSAIAGSTFALQLRAVVPPTTKVKVLGGRVDNSKTRIFFNTQSNKKNSNKIELSGHEQAGLKTSFRELSGNGTKADYEILIDELKNDTTIYNPVFIKISAN